VTCVSIPKDVTTCHKSCDNLLVWWVCLVVEGCDFKPWARAKIFIFLLLSSIGRQPYEELNHITRLYGHNISIKW